MSETTAQATVRMRRVALGLDRAMTSFAGATHTGAIRTGATARAPTAAIWSSSDTAIYISFCVLAVTFTVLQCFGIPVGGDEGTLAIALPITVMVLPVMCFFARPAINPRRVALYALLVVAMGISTGFFTSRFSLASLALAVVIYAPFCLSFSTSDANYRRCLGFFSTLMVCMAGLEFAQHVLQLLAGPKIWPNPYEIFPRAIMMQGYVYLQPLLYLSHFDKPQAFFFLETSLLSQFLALALAIEVVFFRRILRMGLFAAAIFATFAGTGLFLLALSLPVLLGRAGIRTMTLVALVVAVATVLAVEAGWLTTVSHRLTEFQHAGASANRRFVEPISRLVAMLYQSGSFYSGIGAGQIEKSDSYQFWPIAKMSVEYGFASGIIFYGLFLYAMFDRPVSRALAFTLVIWFTFEGSLLTPLFPFTCLLLSGFFLANPARARVAAQRTRREPPAVR